MAAVLHLIPGSVWFAGFELPFYVSRGLVEGAARDIGFRSPRVLDREEQRVPSDVPARGDWSYWATGTYAGPERDYTLKPDVAWLYQRKPPVPAPVTVPVVAPQVGQTAWDVAAGALASGDPTVIRTGAEMVRRAGYPDMAADMDAYAGTLVSGASGEPETAPVPDVTATDTVDATASHGDPSSASSWWLVGVGLAAVAAVATWLGLRNSGRPRSR